MRRTQVLRVWHRPLKRPGFQPLSTQAAVVCLATPGRRKKLGLEGRKVRVPELLAAPDGARQVAQNPPVFPRHAGGGHGLAPALHPAFEVGGGALLLSPHAARQHQIGHQRGLGGQDVDDHQKIQRAQTLTHQRRAGGTDRRVATDDHHRVYVCSTRQKQLLGAPAHTWQAAFRHAPEVGHEAAVCGTVQVAVAGKLVVLLTVFAPALAVALAGQGTVAAAGPAEVPAQEGQVDEGADRIGAVHLLLGAAPAQNQRAVRLGILAGQLPEGGLVCTGGLGHAA